MEDIGYNFWQRVRGGRPCLAAPFDSPNLKITRLNAHLLHGNISSTPKKIYAKYVMFKNNFTLPINTLLAAPKTNFTVYQAMYNKQVTSRHKIETLKNM